MSAFEKIETRPNAEEWHSKEEDLCPLDDTVLYYSKTDAKVSGDVDLGLNDREGTSVYVTSKQLILWNDELQHGITVSYPNIALHAIQMYPVEAVYVQLKELDGAEDEEFIDFSIIPVVVKDATEKSHSSTASKNGDDSSSSSSSSDEEKPADPSVSSEVHKLYSAISACQELYPDVDESDEDQDNPDGTKGDKHQWITAENVQDGSDIDVPTGIEIGDILDTKAEKSPPQGTPEQAKTGTSGKTELSPTDDSEAPPPKIRKT